MVLAFRSRKNSGSSEKSLEDSMISFPSAIKMAYQRYAEFSGRSTRAEFWWFNLYFYSLTILLLFIGSAVFGVEFGFISFAILWIAHIIPIFSTSVRRLHDTGKTGWWLLLGIVPFGPIVIFVFHLLMVMILV